MSRRIPWVASLMSIVLPGLGQLYNAQVNRGIWCFLVFITLLLPLTALAILYLPSAVMLPALIFCTIVGLSAWFYSIVDAFLVARKQPQFTLKTWQTTGFYTLVVVMFCFVVLPLSLNYVRQHQVQAFSIASGSMQPTLQRGDFIFSDMRYNCASCMVGKAVARGDIVLFVYPNNRTQHYIKRVIGLPGDKVDIKGAQVTINGKRLVVDPYKDATLEEFDGKRWRVADNAKQDETLSVVVEPGHVFVLGDNRGKSNDSRVFGSVPLSDVVGKARQIWYSKNEDGTQWDRIGQVLE